MHQGDNKAGTVNIHGTQINYRPNQRTSNLGIFVYCKLDLKTQISNICRTSYFQLRQLRTVRQSLGPEILKTLLHNFVACQLDCCNSLYAGLPACDIAPLQSVQNAAARLFGGVSNMSMLLQSCRLILRSEY